MSFSLRMTFFMLDVRDVLNRRTEGGERILWITCTWKNRRIITRDRYLVYFERSEFLIATSKKKKLTVCVDVCVHLFWF